ncbi:hypothetical protein G5V59_12490 [Nocardioides sp. W3-2-3]|nr:hypothetical protein [Nocardioides convexus]
MADQAQYSRNAQDGIGWLTQVDSALDSVTTSVKRARDLALQGANASASGPVAREALATEVDGIKAESAVPGQHQVPRQPGVRRGHRRQPGLRRHRRLRRHAR